MRSIGDKYRPEAIFIDVVFSSTRKDETIGQLASALCELRDKDIQVYLAGLMDNETRRVRVRPELEAECEKGRVETAYINYQPHHVDRLVWDYDLRATHGAHAQSASHEAPHSAARHTASNDIRTPALAIAQDIFNLRVPEDHEAMALTWGIDNLALPRYADWCRQTAGGLRELVPPRLRWWDSDALLPACPYSRLLSMRDLFVSCSEAAGCESDRKKLHDQLDGRVVMIGAYLRGFKDTVATPLHGDIPGVFLHAMALDNLLTEKGNYNRAYEWGMPPAPALLWVGIAAVLVAHFGHAGFKVATEYLVVRRTRQRSPVQHKRLHHAPGQRLAQDVALRVLQMLLTAALMMGFILLVQHISKVGTLPLVDLAITALAAEWLHVTEWFFGFFKSDEDTTEDAGHVGH